MTLENPEFTKEKLRELVLQSRYIVSRRHWKLPLVVYHYSERCIWHKYWNHDSLKLRGMVLHEDTFEVVNRPLCKFFNYGDKEAPSFDEKQEYTCVEKLDGSLGILCYFENQWVWNTSKAFDSEQAKIAKSLLENKYNENISRLNKKWTYCFEIIYPKNKILVDYGDRHSLVLLTVIDTCERRELAESCYSNLTFDRPKQMTATLADLQKYMESQVVEKDGRILQEGYIIHVPLEHLRETNYPIATNHSEILKMEDFKNLPDIDTKRWKSRFVRIKIKYQVYSSTHKLACYANPKDIIQFIKEGRESILDQFDSPGLWQELGINAKVRERAQEMKQEFKLISQECQRLVQEGNDKKLSMKEFFDLHSRHEFKTIILFYKRGNNQKAEKEIWRQISNKARKLRQKEKEEDDE